MSRMQLAPHDRPASAAQPSTPCALPTSDGAEAGEPGADSQRRLARISRELRLWVVSLVLFAPALLPYGANVVFTPPGRLPTGFILYDMAAYTAQAREHFDTGHFRFLYSNPFDTDYDSPAIYVQPMSLVLGAIIHFTGVAPHLLWVYFEVLAGWVCARVALALYAQVVGLGGWAQRLGLLVFFWGGGLIVIAGIPISLATTGTVEHLFILDYMDGWWLLNFGRNLIFPTEALYHALFFGCVLCVIRRRFWAAAVLALVVAWSHPFTGIELLLILVSWGALEVFFVESGAVPRGFLWATLAMLGLHVGYYMVFLPWFPEHRQVMSTFAIAWLLQARTFVPAYALVGALAFWALRRLEIAREFFANTRNRLFLVWFVVAFALANHEFAVKPVQPIHFARGYIWTSLFLIGSTMLVDLFAALRSRGGRVFGSLAVGSVVTVLLLDNALWFGSFYWEGAHGRPEKHWTVTADELALYRWMSGPENRGALVIPGHHNIGYLAGCFTPLRSWSGHYCLTPDILKRTREITAFLDDGRPLDDWRGKTLLVALERSSAVPRWLEATGSPPVYENPSYRVYRMCPPVKRSDQ